MGTRARMAIPLMSACGRCGFWMARYYARLRAAECGFRYRESIFKEHKDWIILGVDLAMTPAPAGELRRDRR